jgi:hypothetical protein
METEQKKINFILERLAVIYNCNVNDFFSEENIITEICDDNILITHCIDKYFFRMISFGKNVVISSDKSLHKWLNDNVMPLDGCKLFAFNQLNNINENLIKNNFKLKNPQYMFLSHKNDCIELVGNGTKIKWFEGNKIFELYTENNKFYNALGNKYDPEWPVVIAVAAYDNENIIGVAGGYEDYKDWISIGIDVKNDYRHRGIGSYLVGLMKKRIEKMGKMPVYSTTVSNLFSWNIALKNGFIPKWITVVSNN